MINLSEIKTSELAKLLKVSPQYVSAVKAGRRNYSAPQSLKINKEYNIPLNKIRPDIYPKRILK